MFRPSIKSLEFLDPMQKIFRMMLGACGFFIVPEKFFWNWNTPIGRRGRLHPMVAALLWSCRVRALDRVTPRAGHLVMSSVGRPERPSQNPLNPLAPFA